MNGVGHYRVTMTEPAVPSPGTAQSNAPRSGRRAAFVYNPIKGDAVTLRATVSRLSAAAGWDAPLFYETTIEDLGAEATRSALADGADAVLVSGGDGTVRAVVEAMTGSGIPLTIVPSGTGNLLARNLLLPLTDPAAMVQATFDGDRLPVDVGFAAIRREDGTSEERAFVVMGGMGLDAAMIANTSGDLKKRVGWIAYVDGAARSLVNAQPFRIMYQVPGRRLHSAKVQSVLIANCGSLPAGLELIPDASVTDGELDVAIFQPKNALGWVLVWRRVGVGQQRAAEVPRGAAGARSADEGQLGAVRPRQGPRRRDDPCAADPARRRRVRRCRAAALPRRRGRRDRDGAEGPQHHEAVAPQRCGIGESGATTSATAREIDTARLPFGFPVAGSNASSP